MALLFAAISLCIGCSKEEKPGNAPAAAGKPLIIGTDATYPPFETVDEKNELTGVDIDMGRALGAGTPGAGMDAARWIASAEDLQQAV